MNEWPMLARLVVLVGGGEWRSCWGTASSPARDAPARDAPSRVDSQR